MDYLEEKRVQHLYMPCGLVHSIDSRDKYLRGEKRSVEKREKKVQSQTTLNFKNIFDLEIERVNAKNKD